MGTHSRRSRGPGSALGYAIVLLGGRAIRNELFPALQRVRGPRREDDLVVSTVDAGAERQQLRSRCAPLPLRRSGPRRGRCFRRPRSGRGTDRSALPAGGCGRSLVTHVDRRLAPPRYLRRGFVGGGLLAAGREHRRGGHRNHPRRVGQAERSQGQPRPVRERRRSRQAHIQPGVVVALRGQPITEAGRGPVEFGIDVLGNPDIPTRGEGWLRELDPPGGVDRATVMALGWRFGGVDASMLPAGWPGRTGVKASAEMSANRCIASQTTKLAPTVPREVPSERLWTRDPVTFPERTSSSRSARKGSLLRTPWGLTRLMQADLCVQSLSARMTNP